MSSKLDSNINGLAVEDAAITKEVKCCCTIENVGNPLDPQRSAKCGDGTYSEESFVCQPQGTEKLTDEPLVSDELTSSTNRFIVYPICKG